MARGELLQPGVEILQVQKTTSPSFVRPTLVPCVVAPAFEVVNVLNQDATLNSKAKFGAYSQLGSTIPQSAFPDARGNNDELDFIESSIRPFLVSGGTLMELPMAPGEAFLAAAHLASKAAVQSAVFGAAAGLDLKGKTLVLALDQVVRADTSKDVVVTFVAGTGTGATNTAVTAAEAAAQINAAVGYDVASVVADKVQITSAILGALSSVTVRKGASANTLLALGAAAEQRIEGAGFRGQDDGDADTITPWVDFSVGGYYVDGVLTNGAVPASMGWVKMDGTFTSTVATAVTFGEGGTIPVKAGDYVFVDGLRYKGGEITRVEGARFRMGTINAARSTADDQGRYTAKVYDTVEVGTLIDSTPFAPRFVYFRATSLDWKKLAPTAASVASTTTAVAALQAVLTSSAQTTAAPFNATGLYLDYTITVDGVETDGRFTFTNSYATMTLLAAAVQIPGVTASMTGSAPEKLSLTTVKAGATQAIAIKASSTAATMLGFVGGGSATGTDAVFTGLTGSLSFKLNKNPHVYTVPVSSTNATQFISDINAMAGTVVASLSPTRQLVLTSTLKGVASEVVVTAAPTGLTISTSAVTGTGRPLPDAYLNDLGELVVSSELLRDQVTGLPLDQSSNVGTLYIQFRALRRDVSASAKDAGVLRMPDVTTLGQVLNPLTEENPLGLGLFLAMINAPGFEVKGLGLDEVSGAAPEGTLAAHARAAALLEAEEVYAVAPLSQDEGVTALWRTHCVAMSEPEQGGERIAFINHPMPIRKNSALVVTGTGAATTGVANQLLLDANPASGLVDLGLNPALPFSAATGVYAEFEVAGELKRYSVSGVTGALVNLRTAFAGAENVDGFYATSALTASLVNVAYALKVRGASLLIPGSQLMDWALVAETVAEANEGIKQRRSYSVFPEKVKATIGGIEKALPGYYACAGIVGMVASQSPQQPFTNLPIAGLTGVVGTEKFSKRQLNIMAGGGTYILHQEVEGGPVSCRHQLSTDLTSIETRELSITKTVDFVAKFMRSAVRKFVGTNVIGDQLLDAIGTAINGVLAFLVEAGVLNGANLNNLAQDSSSPDTVVVDITLDVPYPCNYIRLTLVV